MKNLEARLQRVEKSMVSNNQESFFFFVEDPSNETRPHFTACSELSGWTILANEGESIEAFHERIKKEYKQAVKLKGKRLESYVILFGNNPE